MTDLNPKAAAAAPSGASDDVGALHFTKMHGIGNDYVYVDAFAQQIADPVNLARVVSDRHRGIGSDGLILVAPPTDAGRAAGAVARMEMYNADGSRGEMCGNGIRCVAKFVAEQRGEVANPLTIETDAGLKVMQLTLDAHGRVTHVRVDMGAPILEPAGIPTAMRPAAESRAPHIIEQPLEVAGQRYAVTAVSMGNPHAVVFVDRLEAIDLATVGPAFEMHAMFPQRVNAHFVDVLSAARVRMITWERGSGATLACGTGACAVCVAGVLTERTERHITAELPGGELELDWDLATNHVFMTGPATEVFRGTLSR